MTTKKIKTSDILGDNYYIYELTSSNYTPALNDTITITCVMKDVYGAAAGSKSITLYQNSTSISTKTTNSNGVATWSVTCSNTGIQSFKVGNKAIEVFVDNKEDKSNKVTSLSENSTNTQYPSAKTVYDELMTVRTVTPSIDSGGSQTLNNVTKNWHYSGINSSDLEYFEKIVYNITFEDNDFQMFYQVVPSMGGGGNSDIKIIYFDGTDCYWGTPSENSLTKGSLICEGNTIQAIFNKDRTVTIGDTITNWDIDGTIIMFGNVDFTYTIYSHKYLDSENFLYVFEDQEAHKYTDDEYTINSITKNIGEYYFYDSSLNNIIETTYTFTFNDNDCSFIDINYDYTIFFDGTDCYWGEWDGNDYSVLNKGTLICEGNVVQAIHKSTDGSNGITFSDGTSTYFSEQYYFGDVSIKMRNKAPKLEYGINKVNSLSNSYYDESIVYPSVNAVKNYAEDKSNKTSSWNSTTDNIRYPTEKLVKDSLDGKQEKLVSGTNLKTLNGANLLGKGDIIIDVSYEDIDVSYEENPLLFEDVCDSASGLSNYGSSECVRGSGSSMSVSYDSTENAYKCSGSGNWYSIIPIPILNDTDSYIIEADFKIQNINETGIGLCIDNRNDSTSYSYACWIEGGSGKFIGKQFNLNTDGAVRQYYDLGLDSSKWYHMKLIVDGSSLSGKLYDGTTLISSDSDTLTVSNSQVGIFLMTQNGTTNSACWVKNIKAETINNDLTTYLLDTSNYEFMTGNSTKLSIENDNELKGTSSLICLNNDTFTNSNNYTLTFDWKLSSGLDGGIVIGNSNNWISMTQQYSQFAIQHGSGTNDGANPAYDQISSSHRYSSYVPVIITRDGYDWTLDVNDGEITSSWTATVDHPNRFGIRTWSPTCYVRNLQLQSNEDDESNIIYLGDDIMTMIDTALGHMITNWEDYE